MIYPALITILVIFLHMALTNMVGGARGKFNVPAPATTGNVEFEKRLRVQQNTIEQTVIFLPALWMFSVMLEHQGIAGILGAGWLVGRVMYAIAYINDPKKRGPGFFIGMGCTILLTLGALWGVVVKLATQ